MIGSNERKYSQIVPALDWFFVHRDSASDRPPTVWRIAVWAIDDEGQVQGLISVSGPGQATPKFVRPPSIPGAYLYIDQLDDAERKQTGVR